MRARNLVIAFMALLGPIVWITSAEGVVSQIDGTIVPTTGDLQTELIQHEGDPSVDPLALDAVEDAYLFPQVFLPSEPDSEGHRYVTFTDIQELAGFENTFGWYNAGDISRLFKVFGCSNEPDDATTIDFTVELDASRWDGGYIGFFLITPEDNDGGNCGDFDPPEYFGHIYYTESELNGDGDYVHNLVFSSKKDPNRFYFAFEDLFRGGDNDFTDMTIKVEGLTPPCVPKPEVCDGQDNDCDGVTDEDPTDTGGPCGSDVGECSLGAEICQNGLLVCDGDVKPQPETCDGKDNDCDGVTDNNPIDAGGTCGTNLGECSFGVQACQDGALVCQGGVLPQPEICDGLDNDCDGTADNNLTDDGLVCGVNVGQCQQGVTACVAGHLVCQGGVLPQPEVCDGLDNDCNGTTDDNPIDAGGNCGSNVGECKFGHTVCSAGSLICQGTVGPQPEICDGKDNDCDGMIDNNTTDTGGVCGTDLGQCQQGTWSCSNGHLVCQGGVLPQPEVCDGLDNDCDGTTDNNPIDAGAVCGINVGQCRAGSLQCLNGTLACIGEVLPQPEICDGLDNDCDGIPDNNLTDAGGPCGSDVGECQQGTNVCQDGHLICQGGANPHAEVCDGLDNDCDGVTDNNLTDVGAVCGSNIGSCLAGTIGCVDGTLTCQGGVGPQVEVCDGLDNDCNGIVDDNLIDVGQACGEEQGRCQPGETVCAGGSLICQGGVGPQNEICDGLDNDCNGIVDDDDPGGGGPCGVTDEGECRMGIIHCVAGSLVCEGATNPVMETCDGLDNDCDGVIDNDVICPPGTDCLEGACRINCSQGEFACPVGMECIEGYCIPTACFGVICDPGEMCVDGQCVELCDMVECAEDELCIEGQCIEESCYGMGCPDEQICLQGECVPNPCDGVECRDRQFCVDGACVNTCERVVCAHGQTCVDGACRPDPCIEKECGWGNMCVDGVCRPDPCQDVFCRAQRICQEGQCVDDPCAHVVCPLGGVCQQGQCYDPPEYIPGQPDMEILATGPGGCSCHLTGGKARPPLLMALLMLALVLCFRRRKRGQSRNVSFFLLAMLPAALAGMGCDLDPYTIRGTDGYLPSGDGGINPHGDSGPCVPTNNGVEICDEVDNNCNGQVDEGFDLLNDPLNCGGCNEQCVIFGAYSRCVSGECIPSGQCLPGFWDLDGDLYESPTNGCEYECVPTNGGEEICDGLDNDCNGFTDELFDLANDPSNCGLCGKNCLFTNGEGECVNGQCRLAECSVGFWNANGIENDGCEYACDLTNDGVEICDGLDNDCNGQIDDGVDTSQDPANCGACGNVCIRPNAQMGCTNGGCVVVSCSLGYHNANNDPDDGCEYACEFTNSGTEICDGLDNNCNGQIDDNPSEAGGPCGSDVGRCQPGVWVCSGGVLTCSGGVGPTPERCDNIDNDCDGITDNNTVDTGGICGTGVGECSTGTLSCVSGALVCQGGTGPQPEICDGKDNDCDGIIDNHLTDTGGGCGTDTGECQQGVLACSAGTLFCSGSIPPAIEICDGKDNDCDGITDNDPTDAGGPCGTDLGECQRGTWVCTGGTLDCQGATGPQLETCDGKDNDCDGVADNNLTDTGGTCGTDTGECQQGTWACSGGVLTCAGAKNPTPEVCDNLDNDCDGITDNNTIDTGDLCGSSVGECEFGVTACQAGGNIVCQGEVGPQPELCDGKDNDCNGQIDDNPQGVGLQCGTSDVGECQYGVTACSGGALICQGNVEPQSEICDGKDNDCDGTTDINGCMTEGAADVRLDSSSTAGAANSIQVDIAASGDRIHVVWLDARSGWADIYHTCSTDGGLNWTSDARLDRNYNGNNTDSVKPRVLLDDAGWVYVAYEDFRRGTYRDIYLRRSSTCGGSSVFSSERRLDAGNIDSLNIDLAADGSGDLFVVFEDFIEGQGTQDSTRYVYLASSVDFGDTFNPPVRVDHPPASPYPFAASPRVAIGSGGRALVVWQDRRNGASDIYLNHTDDHGLSFLPQDLRLDTDAAGSAASKFPRIAADPSADLVYVVWQDLRRVVFSDIYFTLSSDNGDTWNATDLHLDADGGDSNAYEPNLTLGQPGYVHCAWQDFREGLPMVRIITSQDGGQIFNPSIRASFVPGGVFEPKLSANGLGKVFVAYASDADGLKDIYINYSLDDGASFQPFDLRMDSGSLAGQAESFSLALATGGSDAAYAVWVDTRTNGIRGDIYFNYAQE